MDTQRSLVLGTMNFGRLTDGDQAQAILRAAHELGISAVNTADVDYSGRSEHYVGRFLSQVPKREHPWLMVELSGPDMGVPNDPELTPGYLAEACKRSLRRLGVDQIDRVVVPRPSFRIPIEETFEGVHRLIVTPGLAASVGVSTFPAWMTCDILHTTAKLGVTQPTSELAPYNLLDRRVENELLPNSRRWKLEFFAWAPLAQGLLAGRYTGAALPSDSRASLLGGIYRDRVSPLKARSRAADFLRLCRRYGLEPSAAAIAWLLRQPGVAGAVFGPRTPEHVRSAAAARAVVLDRHFLTEVDRINPPGTACVDFFNSAPWMLECVGDGRMNA
ncbi:aldo/keto reductase [Micromonospora chalcea]